MQHCRLSESLHQQISKSLHFGSSSINIIQDLRRDSKQCAQRNQFPNLVKMNRIWIFITLCLTDLTPNIILQLHGQLCLRML